jgi:peptidoglycan/LPS O-acetylase OafA/YrhL
MTLDELAHGRNNNFNLIRMAAAIAVLFSHSFLIVGAAEPLWATLNVTWGIVAVDVFFVTSGFLVAASLLTRNGALDFLWARGLRIYPALWLMLGLTVFVIGALFTTHSLQSYFTDRVTWHYLVKAATLVDGLHYALPGVFESAPLKGAVNGSLWTLVPEIWMYALLLMVWLGAFIARGRRVAAMRLAIITIAVVSGAWYLHQGVFEPATSNYPRFAFMFFTGASYFVLKDKVELRPVIFWALLSMIALSLLNRTAFFYVFNIALAYVLLYAAYVFGGRIRLYNRFGDYSYGFYIYAFPVQQSLASVVHGISVTLLMLSSAALTFGLAALSWHLMEKRALLLKTVCANTTRDWAHSMWHFVVS